MKEYKTSELIDLTINSDLHIEHKLELFEILRALKVIHPWEVDDIRKIIMNNKNNL